MPRQSRLAWRIAVWVIGVFLFLLLIVVPVCASFLFRFADELPDGWEGSLDIVESLLSAVMLTFFVVWVFFVGGTFASFLNVVAWRVPRGKSILGSSHCPYCNVKLTFRDNIPVLGWVKNFGRCSNCRLPISSRYVWVEVVLGLIFLVVVSAMLMTGGATLPNRMPGPPMTFSRMLLEPKLDLVATLVFHLTALLGIFTFVLIELERRPLPTSIFLVTLMFLAGMAALWPHANPVDIGFPLRSVQFENVRMNSLVCFSIGTVVGFMVGWLIDCVWIKTDAAGLAFGLSIVGAVCGWQSVLVVALFWFILSSLIPPRSFEDRGAENVMGNLLCSPNAKTLVAFLIHLATWRWFDLIA